MEIILNEQEFTEAANCYLKKQGFDISKYTVDIRMVQGRAGSGNRVEISLEKKVNSTIVEDESPIKVNDIEKEVTPVESETTNDITVKKPPFGKLFAEGE